jgi:hypothetical protein
LHKRIHKNNVFAYLLLPENKAKLYLLAKQACSKTKRSFVKQRPFANKNKVFITKQGDKGSKNFVLICLYCNKVEISAKEK